MKACKDCPFKRSSPLNGSPEWLKDVLELNAKDPFFHHTCHKTDPKADGYVGGEKVMECGGHVQMMMNEIDGTHGKGGVYFSIKDMGREYLKHWQKELDSRKSERP